jgi:hypothetical protein
LFGHNGGVKVLAVLLLLISLCGCSPQKTLAHRLKDADRVIVVNPYDGATTTVMSDQLTSIVQAIEASQEVKAEGLANGPGYTLIFYKTAVHVATVPTGSDIIFYIDHTPYHDKSGTLTALCQKFRQEHPKLLSP